MTKQTDCLIAATFMLLILPASLANAQVSFAPLQNYPLKTAPYRTVIGDFNGDGKPDLATLSIYGGTVSILLNNGNATFASAQYFPAIPSDPQGPTSFSNIAMGDVDGDGKLDVIVSHTTDRNTGAGVVNVLLGNGDGTLQRPISTAVDSFAYNLFGVGDFNGDGKLDIVCAADDSANTISLLVLFLGNGTGGFTRASTSPPGDAGWGVNAVVADLNHDGKLDVVLGTQNSVTGFLGNGDGTFQPSFQVPTPTPAFFLSSGDFDHDGEPDLISTSFQQYRCVCPGFGVPPRYFPTGPPGAATVLMGKGDGTFGGPGLISNADFLEPVVGDFDGDGNLDFAAAALAGPPPPGYSGSFSFFLGNGQRGFSAPVSSALASSNIAPGQATNIVSGDLDGDGFADLVHVLSTSLQVTLNTTATFLLSASAPGPPIQAGGTARYTITVSQQHGFSNSVALSCSAFASSGVHCSISPASVTPGGTATLNITTMGASASLAEPANQSHSGLLFALWLPIGSIFFGGRRSKQYISKTFLAVILGSVISTGLLLQVACGGGNTAIPHIGGTPVGTYTIMVTGTSGATQHSATVDVTVQ